MQPQGAWFWSCLARTAGASCSVGPDACLPTSCPPPSPPPFHAHPPPAGVAPLLEDSSTSLTLFAPANEAWAAVPPQVDLKDTETLQQVRIWVIKIAPRLE